MLRGSDRARPPVGWGGKEEWDGGTGGVRLATRGPSRPAYPSSRGPLRRARCRRPGRARGAGLGGSRLAGGGPPAPVRHGRRGADLRGPRGGRAGRPAAGGPAGPPGPTEVALALAALQATGTTGAAPSGRWFSLAGAVQQGVQAALAARAGATADLTLLDGRWSSCTGLALDADVLVAPAEGAAIEHVSCKPYCAARQVTAAVHAFRLALQGAAGGAGGGPGAHPAPGGAGPSPPPGVG